MDIPSIQYKNKCCVPKCTNKTDKRHRFPRDVQMLNKWVDAIKSPKLQNLESYEIYMKYYVCHTHFSKDHVVPGTRRGLRKDAVPSLCLGASEITLPSTSTSGNDANKETDYITMMEVPRDCTNTLLLCPTSAEYPSGVSVTGAHEILTSIKSEMDAEATDHLVSTGIRRFHFLTDTERSICRKAKNLRRKAGLLLKNENVAKAHVKAAMKLSRSSKLQKLARNLTPSQTRLLDSQLRNSLTKATDGNYTFQDKTHAIATWMKCPKTYELLSKVFALPSIRTLRTTLNLVPIQPGVSQPTFQALERRVGRLRRKQRLCTLIFGEIPLQPYLAHAPHEGVVIGFEDDGCNVTQNVADVACVFMLRGLFGRWKQPVAFAFCKSAMPAETIVRFYREIIRRATAVGLNVVASVCDEATNNRKAIRLLTQDTQRAALARGEAVDRNVIRVDGHDVVPLFDPPHLLKSLRNSLLVKDCRFRLDGEDKLAKWDHILGAYRLDKDIRFMWKVTESHVNPEKLQKRKVSVAAQVFSYKVASYIAFVAGKSRPGFEPVAEEATDTAWFAHFVDNVFDSVNGGLGRTGDKALRRMVGPKSRHLRTWCEGSRTFSEMAFVDRCSGERSRPPVLDCWCRTLDGFVLVRKQLLALGYHRFAARAFNLDPLENLFGLMRQCGVRFASRTCKTFFTFYKAWLVRRFSSYHSRMSGCEEDKDSLLVTIGDLLRETGDSAR